MIIALKLNYKVANRQKKRENKVINGFILMFFLIINYFFVINNCARVLITRPRFPFIIQKVRTSINIVNTTID